MYFALVSSDILVFEEENVEVFDNFPINYKYIKYYLFTFYYFFI